LYVKRSGVAVSVNNENTSARPFSPIGGVEYRSPTLV